MSVQKRDADEVFWQQFVFPEEERRQWTTAKWDGSYRGSKVLM